MNAPIRLSASHIKGHPSEIKSHLIIKEEHNADVNRIEFYLTSGKPGGTIFLDDTSVTTAMIIKAFQNKEWEQTEGFVKRTYQRLE